MDNADPDSRLDVLLRDIDLPNGAYERAESRYKDLGQWISRPESTLKDYDAHVFVQGSFALGTAVRPVNSNEEYDLDFTCKLRHGASRLTHTQAELKELIGIELESYRLARQIESPLETKHRCWRLSYKDDLPFHMDVVPGIRADDMRRTVLTERMVTAGIEQALAANIARRALWITDDEDENFRNVHPDWPSSNPGGYQEWFLSRIRRPKTSGLLVEAQVDPVPVFRARSPLQQAVQLLKRHRDVMFADEPDLKPASILITTIAGRQSHPGEALEMTLRRALEGLRQVRDSGTFEILNPINRNENFADRWAGSHCPLRQNFYEWINAADNAFDAWLGLDSPQRLLEVASDDFAVELSGDAARSLTASGIAVPTARRVEVAAAPPTPWRR